MVEPFSALQRVSSRSLTLLLSRAEFAGLELGQACRRLMRWVAMALACTVIFHLAVLAASAAFVLALWERLGWIAPLAMAVAYGGAGAVLLARLRREIESAPPPLARTLAELAADRAALFGGVSGDRTRSAGADEPGTRTPASAAP